MRITGAEVIDVINPGCVRSSLNSSGGLTQTETCNVIWRGCMSNTYSLAKREGELTCNPHQRTSNIRVWTYPDWATIVLRWIQTINRGERLGINFPLWLREVIRDLPVHDHGKNIFMCRCFAGIITPAVERRCCRVVETTCVKIHLDELWECGRVAGVLEGGSFALPMPKVRWE